MMAPARMMPCALLSCILLAGCLQNGPIPSSSSSTGPAGHSGDDAPWVPDDCDASGATSVGPRLRHFLFNDETPQQAASSLVAAFGDAINTTARSVGDEQIKALEWGTWRGHVTVRYMEAEGGTTLLDVAYTEPHPQNSTVAGARARVEAVIVGLGFSELDSLRWTNSTAEVNGNRLAMWFTQEAGGFRVDPSGGAIVETVPRDVDGAALVETTVTLRQLYDIPATPALADIGAANVTGQRYLACSLARDGLSTPGPKTGSADGTMEPAALGIVFPIPLAVFHDRLAYSQHALYGARCPDISYRYAYMDATTGAVLGSHDWLHACLFMYEG